MKRIPSDTIRGALLILWNKDFEIQVRFRRLASGLAEIRESGGEVASLSFNAAALDAISDWVGQLAFLTAGLEWDYGDGAVDAAEKAGLGGHATWW